MILQLKHILRFLTTNYTAITVPSPGPVNHLLSWPGFVPLGRLTYFAYLVHPLMQIIYHSSHRSIVTAYDYATVSLSARRYRHT